MKKLWILFLIAISLNIYSQERKIGKNINDMLLDQNEKSIIKDSGNRIINLSDTKGSPYFKDFFLSGTVFAEKTNESLGYQLRYNIYNDEIEVENSSDNTLSALKKDSNYSCKIMNDSFKYLEYTDKDNESQNGYFHELTEGKTVLLLKYECKYQPKKTGKPPVYKVTPARFVTQKTYYLLSNDQLTLISTKKKKLLEYFGSHKGAVNSYINKNNLKLNNDRDLIRVITYYNSIL